MATYVWRLWRLGCSSDLRPCARFPLQVGETNVTISHETKMRVPNDHGTGLAVLLRGIHAPQMWFALPPPACTRPTALHAWACTEDAAAGTQATAVAGLGSVVFVTRHEVRHEA